MADEVRNTQTDRWPGFRLVGGYTMALRMRFMQQKQGTQDADESASQPLEADACSPRRRIGRQSRQGAFAGAAIAWACPMLLGAGCQVAEPYLMPQRTVEMLNTLQADLRPGAQLPMVRERDRAPVLVRRRALALSEEELARGTARPSRYYRVRAGERPPLFYVGGITLGMGLPYFLIGLMTGLDPVGSAAPTRAITDLPGGAVMLSLSALHIGIGGLMMAIGERRPQVEPADRGLVQQYVDGTAPLLITGPPPPKEDAPADPAEPSTDPTASPP